MRKLYNATSEDIKNSDVRECCLKIGATIRSIREIRGQSQEQLAEKNEYQPFPNF